MLSNVLLLLGVWILLLLGIWLGYWRDRTRKVEAARKRLLDRHNELRGEGDECPWSIRLTAADKREAMHRARVELGLEEAPEPEKGWVYITHATSLGEVARVTEESYHAVWKQKGWILTSTWCSWKPSGRSVPDQPSLLPRMLRDT